jgi:predicted GNAT family acetyltransferase
MQENAWRELWAMTSLASSDRDDRAATFEGPRIVAMAGYRPWSATAGDPCVLTHPERRRSGCGTAVVSQVVASALERQKTVLYQTLEANEPAVRLARRLGYQPYATHVAVRLRSAEPS